MSTSPISVLDFYNAYRIEPSVFSRVDIDTTPQQSVPALRDVIFLSTFEGGIPGLLTPFIDPRDVQITFDPENIGIGGVALYAFVKQPSFEPTLRGAYRTWIARVGQPTQSALTLKDGAAADVIHLISKDYGIYVNKLSAIVATGTVVGKKVVIGFGQREAVTVDNLRDALDLAYTGNGSAATMTITRAGNIATRLQTTITGATDGSISLDLNLTDEQFATISQLCQYLNAENGYTCSLNRYTDPGMHSSELDAASAVDIRTPNALIIQYTGAGSAATMTTTDTALTTAITGGPGGETLNIDLTLAATDTLAELVAAIDGLAAYTCTLAPGADGFAPVSGSLVNVVAQAIKATPYTLKSQAGEHHYTMTAALGSIITAINSRAPRVTATRVDTATTVPANLGKTFFAGGTNPTSSVQDWLDALDVVDSEDLEGGLIFINTTSETIQASTLAWLTTQNQDKGKKYRAFFGAAPGLDLTDYRALANSFDSRNVSLAFQRILSPLDGLTELPPLYYAAIKCGMASGVPHGQTTTNKRIRAAGLIDKYTLAVREQAMLAGLDVLKDQKGGGIITAFSLTTSLSQNRIDRVLSESMAVDFIDETIKLQLRVFLGGWVSQKSQTGLLLLPSAKERVINALKSLEADGLITQGNDPTGKIIPAFDSPQLGFQAGLLRVLWHAKIGGEVDQIGVLGVISYQTFAIQLPVAA